MQVERSAEREQRSRLELGGQTVVQILRHRLEWLEQYFELLEDLAREDAAGDVAAAAATTRRLRQATSAERGAVFEASLEYPAAPAAAPPIPSAEEADRAFQASAEPPLAGGTPSGATATGSVVSRPSLRFTRRLASADGHFLAVGVVLVDAELLSRHVAALGSELGHAITLATADLPVAPEMPQASGQALTIIRQPLPNWPLVVRLSLSTAPVLEELDRLRWRCWLAWAGLALLLTCAWAVAALRQSRNRLRQELQLAEASRDELSRVLDGVEGYVFLCRLRPDGSVTGVHHSAGLARLLRLADDVAPGQGRVLRHLEPPTTQQERQAAYADLLRHGRHSTERQLRRADDTLAWIRLTLSVVGRDDEDLHVVGLATDIDDERAATGVAIASARLATVAELAGGLAHELNQPLAIILLSADNIQSRLKRDAAKAIPFALERLERIAGTTLRARNITDHLRLFTASESGPPTATDIHASIRGALLLCNQALQDANVAVEDALPASLPPVLGKQVMLEHVLLALLLNARDAMQGQPADTRHIRLAATVSGQRVRLTVTDSGPGLAPDVLPRLFQPFFSGKGSDRNSGLGLFVAQSILRPWGASITGANAPADGLPGGADFTLDMQLAA